MQSLFAAILITVVITTNAAAAEPSPASVSRRTPFTHFGSKPVLELRGNSGAASVDFGSRADELVTRAAFHIRYSYSPALIATRSQIRLTLNDEVIGLLPVNPENAGRTVVHDIEVDPRLFVSFNKLVLNLVVPPAPGVEDPTQAEFWANVSAASELEVSVRPLVLSDDLALLPEPFFDRRDQRRVTLPFAFGAQPSRPTLRAAAVVASWFGQLATWHGVRFPVRLDEAVQGHAIAFATNSERPAFLRALPPVTAPQIRIMTNPADDRSKLLLLLGRDGNDLKAAADALVLGSAAFSGAAVQVKDAERKALRQAYDAPGWVRLERAMKLGELIEWPQQLQASGRPPELDPIRVNLRMPPDLVAWRGPGVPMTLKFHYTPPACAGESYLDVSINDELLKVVSLRTAHRQDDVARPGQPLPDAIADTSEILIPAFRLRSRIQLQFGFRFAVQRTGECRDTQPDTVRAVVDADSSIDFSGLPHYAQMPHLGHFATVGFPFTKYADLAQTVVVLPERPGAQDIETLLTLLGRLGESSGYPATGVRIAGAAEEAMLEDADILIIGASAQQGLLEKWSGRLPVALSGPSRRISQPARRAGTVYDWLGFGSAPDPAVIGQVSIEGDGPLAVLLGFESPLTPGRSVVAATAVAPNQLLRVLDALDDPQLRRLMAGSAVFIHPNKVESVLVGRTYAIGFLPPWTGLWYELSGRPVLTAALAALALSILAYAVWRATRAIAARRRRRTP